MRLAFADPQGLWGTVHKRAFPRGVAPISASEWARRHCRLSPESSSAEGPFRPMPFQADWMDVMGMDGGPSTVVIAKSARAGYALAMDTPVLTTKGFKPLADIEEGDRVFHPSGRPVKVLAALDPFLPDKCYELKFSDGSTIRAHGGHLWRTHAEKLFTGRTGRPSPKVGPPNHTGVRTTKEIADTLNWHGRKGNNHSIAVSTPLRFDAADWSQQKDWLDSGLPIHPYTLGMWLADGDVRNGVIAQSVKDLPALIEALTECGEEVSIGPSAETVRRVKVKGLSAKLSALFGVRKTRRKYIPNAYMTAPVPQREELLRGILDGDGSVEVHHGKKCGSVSLNTTNKLVFDQICLLMRGLGMIVRERTVDMERFKSQRHRKTFKLVYSLRTHPNGRWLFRYKRKQDRVGEPLDRRGYSTFVIRAAKEIPVETMRCITVDADDGMWLAGRSLVPTHNSAALLGSMCYLLAEVKRNIVCYQPTDIAAKEWAREAIHPALRDCDVTAQYLDEVEDKRVGRQTQIWIGGKGVSIKGANSPINFRRHSADASLIDEADGCPIDVGGEGSTVALASRSLVTSSFRKLIVGSTPVDAGVSLIWDELMAADAKFLYFVECPLCHALGPLEWERLIWNKEGTRSERANSVRYQCADCDGEWRQPKLQAALAGGRWQVPEAMHGHKVDQFVGCWIRRGDHYPDFVAPDGKALPWPDNVGFHVWRAYSTLSPWRDIPDQLIKAGKNPLALKTFQNHVRGLPWGGDLGAKSAEEVDAMRRPIEALPPEAAWLFMAVDCQKEHLSVALMAVSADFQVWFLSRDEYHGNPELDDGAAWAMLYDVLREGVSWPITRAGKTARLPLAALAIDTGGLYTQSVYRGCMRLATVIPNVIPIKGAAKYDTPIVTRSSTTTESGIKIPLFNIGTHKAKVMASHLVGRGQLAINNTCPRAINDELVAERLVLRRTGGRMVHRWENLGGDNEAFDQLVMAVALWSLAKPTEATAPKLSKFHAVKVGPGGVAVSARQGRALDIKRQARRNAGAGRIGRARFRRR